MQNEWTSPVSLCFVIVACGELPSLKHIRMSAVLLNALLPHAHLKVKPSSGVTKIAALVSALS